MKKYLFILLVFFSGCVQKKLPLNINPTSLQHTCVHRLTDVIVYDIFTPPVASRIYAYCNLAYFESVRWNDSTLSSMTKNLKGFSEMPQPLANHHYNFSLAAVKAFFNVANKLTFSHDSLRVTEEKLLNVFKVSLDEDVYKNSIGFGDSVSKVIMQRALEDNYKITRGMPRYSVFREKGKWVHTPPDYSDGVEPNWKLIQPLLLDSAAQFKPIPPIPYDLTKGSPYYIQLMEVYQINNQLTATMDTVAHYWDDNPFVTEYRGHLKFANKKTTPVGHWMGITSIICLQEKASELFISKSYAITSAAIFDAFISCWDEKYRSQTIRPITIIRENIDEKWTPLLQTPPFPEYTSGHSVVSAAAATVLENLFGKSVAFHDSTEIEYLGLSRSFSSIKAAADEAGISRLYGGIHFRAAIEEGKKQGEKIGDLYNASFKTP